MLMLVLKAGEYLEIGSSKIDVLRVDGGRVELACGGLAVWQGRGGSFAVGKSQIIIDRITCMGNVRLAIEAPPEVRVIRSRAICRVPMKGAA